MNAKRAKAIRRKAEKYTEHLPELSIKSNGKTTVLGECKRGAYKALKKGKCNVAV